jgi:hypothetical protein
MESERGLRSARSVGRVVGLLFLAQVLLAPPVVTQWGMMGAVIAPDFLAGAAGDATKIRVALLLMAVLSGLTLAVAIVAFPVFRRYSERLALVYLALAVMSFATSFNESHAVSSMLSLSLQYAKEGAPTALLETLATNARTAWSSTHFTNLMLGHVKILAFHGIMLRCALIPRPLAGFGLAAALLSTAAATLPLLGYSFSYPMVAPTALTQLVLALWLTVRGFSERESAGAAIAPQ